MSGFLGVVNNLAMAPAVRNIQNIQVTLGIGVLTVNSSINPAIIPGKAVVLIAGLRSAAHDASCQVSHEIISPAAVASTRLASTSLVIVNLIIVEFF